MKNLNFYKNIGLQTDKQIFNYFIDTMIPTNKTWDYFLNWDKVTSGVDRHRNELDILNPLCYSNSLDEDLKNILRNNPSVVKVFPLLIAMRSDNISILDSFSLPEFNFHTFNFRKPPESDETIELFVEFFKKSGLGRLIEKKRIKNIHDYVLGIEAGLDSNGRKNRSGAIMESLIKNLLTNVYNLDSTNFTDQGDPKKVKELWGIDLPIDKTSRRADFIIYKNNKIFWIETNFYSGGGSKLKSTAGEYKSLYEFCNSNNIEFIWITDGGGWKSAEKAIEETFIETDYIFNLSMVKDGVLKEIIY